MALQKCINNLSEKLYKNTHNLAFYKKARYNAWNGIMQLMYRHVLAKDPLL